MTDTATKRSLSRADRLVRSHAYAAVFSFRCWVTGEWFQVYAKPNGAPAARLGIVVSKRIIPQAVARNYCKRLAREAFRADRAALAGVDLVVRPRTAVTRAASAAARGEIRELLRSVQRRCRSRGNATPNNLTQ